MTISEEKNGGKSYHVTNRQLSHNCRLLQTVALCAWRHDCVGAWAAQSQGNAMCEEYFGLWFISCLVGGEDNTQYRRCISSFYRHTPCSLLYLAPIVLIGGTVSSVRSKAGT